MLGKACCGNVGSVSYDHITAEYDAAFAWESDPAVILPVWERLGRPARVIEFACGPARLLCTLVRNGVTGVGVDLSAPMLDLARQHLDATGGSYELYQAPMEAFRVDRPCGGAFCAVGSFGHLSTRAAALAHLQRARACLHERGRYAIQLSLKPLIRTEPRPDDAPGGWECSLDGETLRYAWYGTGIDPLARQEVQRCRIERLTGPRRGAVIEHDHLMAIWDWEDWSELIETAGFRQVAALDTNDGFRELPLGSGLHEHPQCWHVLEVR